MRSDKKANAIKVLKTVINSTEPMSQRDIADKTDLWLWTVNRAIDELEQNGTLQEPEIIDFVKLDLKLQWLILNEKIRRIEKEAKDQPYQALDSFDNTSFKRSQILQGKATEKIDIWDFSNKTQKELEEARKNLLG